MAEALPFPDPKSPTPTLRDTIRNELRELRDKLNVAEAEGTRLAISNADGNASMIHPYLAGHLAAHCTNSIFTIDYVLALLAIEEKNRG